MSRPTSGADWEAALQRCADEPIHLIGQIQAGSILIALDPATDRFSHLSANIGALLGQEPAELFQVPPSSVLGEDQIAQLYRRALAWRGRGPRLVNITLGAGSTRSAWIHSSGGLLVIENHLTHESTGGETLDPEDWDDAMRESLEKVESSRDLPAMLETVTRETRLLGAFDRVMIYRFLPDETGEVVAEEAREDWAPFFGLRYPASDIPPQARALFLKNDMRLIIDVGAEPVDLLASSADAPALDLSLARYRQPSPVHLEYLRNMGVTSSFVTGVIADGKLWGLISCHHGTPLDLSATRQLQLSALTNHLAVDLTRAARELRLRNELAGSRIANKLIQCVTVTDDWTSVLLSMAGDLCEMLHADGLALRFDNLHREYGLTPEAEVVEALAHQGLEQGGGLPFAYEATSSESGGVDLPAAIGGFLVIPLSRFRDDALVFFRKEQTRKITWAGDPGKQVDLTDGQPRLRPRASFNAWQETVRGGCEQWTRDEIAWAATIGATLSDIVITTHYFRLASPPVANVRHRLALESDTDPVVLADDNGLVVFENAAARTDPLLAGLTSLDLLVTRLSEDQSDELAVALHSLANGIPEIRVPLKAADADDGGKRWLQGDRLEEDGRLAGYSVRVSRTGP